MSFDLDYKKLTVRELWLLIMKNDDSALKEHLRRVKSGEIKTRRYTKEDLEMMIKKAG